MNDGGSVAAKTADRVGVAQENKPAASIAAGLGALTTVLAAAGVTEGVVGRMFGESPTLAGLAAFFALAAGLLGIFAGLFTSKTKHPARELLLLLASNVALFVGLVLGIVAATEVWSNTRTPTLSATQKAVDGATVLEVSVKDSGLGSKEHVRLLVEPVRMSQSKEGQPVRRTGQNLYSAWLGSNEDGEIDHSVDVRLPPHMTGKVGARAFVGEPSDNCYDKAGEGDACVVVSIPHDPEKLQLSAIWGEQKKTLTGRLKARHIADSTVHLRAVGQVRSKPTLHRLLQKWQLSPDVNGAFDHEFSLPGVRRFTWICLVAKTAPVGKCPPPEDTREELVWARYRVPGD